MKKRLIMLLALVMLFAAFSCPALASEPWDLLNSDLSEDYTSAWKVSGGRKTARGIVITLLPSSRLHRRM